MGKRLTVIGASTGAMQALQIGVSYADMAQNFVAVTPPGRTAPRTTNVLARQAIMTDRLGMAATLRLARRRRRHVGTAPIRRDRAHP
jgi:homoserine acetyltransferase